MKITQKKFTNQTHFEFGETSLSFAFGDKGGRQEFTVDYAAIEQSSRDFEDRKTWYRNFGVLWVVLGAVLTGYVYWQSAQINPSLFLFLGIACLVAYQFSLTQYSVFDTVEPCRPMKKLKVPVAQMVATARARIEEVETEDAIKLVGDDGVVIVDIRDVRERQRTGYIPGSVHCPRGMVEFWVDPESPYHKEVFAQEMTWVLRRDTSRKGFLPGRRKVDPSRRTADLNTAFIAPGQCTEPPPCAQAAQCVT